jgi:tetratricopeptide (TPR) repeat protein
MTKLMSGLEAFLPLCTDILAHAEGIEWKTLNDEVVSLYRQGLYDRAIVVAKKALQLAEQAVGKNHSDVAKSLNNLALLYDSQGKFAKAATFCKRSLTIREKALGPDHPDVAYSLNNLAGRVVYFSDSSSPHLPFSSLSGSSPWLNWIWSNRSSCGPSFSQ